MTPAREPSPPCPAPDPAAPAAPFDLAWRVGQASIAALGLILVSWALTIDFPRTTGGFFGDASTYYSLGHSLAEDLDFEFRREDLVRVWREFPSGPQGIFLKRGRDVQHIGFSSSPPFFTISGTPDADGSRLYYAKSFAYPLFAAPLVAVFGTNGFLVLNALLMTLCFACAYAFLVARMPPMAALIFAGAFLFLSVTPLYMVWITPDFFNFALVMFGYFCWAYKFAVANSATACPGPIRRAWLIGPRSDLLAAVFLGIATFSKPTNVFLIAPLLVTLLWRRQWKPTLAVGALFGLVVAGFFAWNVAISGEWNYQGGEERSTFYAEDPDGPTAPRIGGFPFQSDRHTFDTTGIIRETNTIPLEVLTSRDAIGAVFRRNLAYFFIGRHHGFVLYFFPGALAMALFLARARRRPLWQWLTLAAGLGSALFLLLYMPFTYSGGGGPVGNRYFLSVYPLFLFLMPPLTGVATALATVGVSALLTAQLIFNPFYVSTHPAEHPKRAPYRWFPAELTLVNDLPVNHTPSRSRQPLGGTPPLMAFFLDDNAHNREHDAFWVRGESTTELLLRAPVVEEARDGQKVLRPLHVPRMEVQLETGAVGTRVTIDTGEERQVVDMPAAQRQTVVVRMAPGLPYRRDPWLPTNYVYSIRIGSESGFIPMFTSGGGDARHLGVFVRLVPLYE